MGRWLSRDPIGERGGLGVNVFSLNNPVWLIDKFGSLAMPPSEPPPTPPPNCETTYVQDGEICFCTDSRNGRAYERWCGSRCPNGMYEGSASVGHWVYVCHPPEPKLPPDPVPTPPTPTLPPGTGDPPSQPPPPPTSPQPSAKCLPCDSGSWWDTRAGFVALAAIGVVFPEPVSVLTCDSACAIVRIWVVKTRIDYLSCISKYGAGFEFCERYQRAHEEANRAFTRHCQ